MTEVRMGRQVDFQPISEEWGTIRLSDGSKVSTRLILSDLWVIGEDVLGPQIIYSHVAAIRVVCPPQVLDAVKDKQFLRSGESVPLTKEAGYETMDIVEREIPTRSSYRFDGYELDLELEAAAVARNMRYKVGGGAPLYNVRWSVRRTIKRVPESK